MQGQEGASVNSMKEGVNKSMKEGVKILTEYAFPDHQVLDLEQTKMNLENEAFIDALSPIRGPREGA